MSTSTIEATYDGQVIRPDAPLPLKPNTRIRITVTPLRKVRRKAGAFLETARRLKLNAPPDLAENLDEYLYGLKQVNEE